MNNQNDILDAVYKVLSDYSSQEIIIEEKIRNLHSKREENARQNREIPLNFDTHRDLMKTKELATQRNKDLKKELDNSMGKLRSKRCYSPAEDNLHKTIQRYSEILSKPDVE